MYLDGVLKATYTQNIPTGAYEILMNLQVAGSQAAGWHTVAGNSGQFELDVSEVQVYNLAASVSNATAVTPEVSTTANTSSAALVSNATAVTPVVSTTANTSSAASTSTRRAAQVIQQPAPSPIARLKWATQMKPRLAQTDGSAVE